MTLSETRALRHAALLVLGLALLRTGAEIVRSPVTTDTGAVQGSSGLAVLLEKSRKSLDEAERRSLPLTAGERIDPNTAGEEDLDRLPGVGPAMAGRILGLRRDRGPFAGPQDLLLVRGVGPATLARMTLYLEWSAQPRLGGAGRSAGPARKTALSQINTDGVNIMTVEDPVEYNLHGINQVLVRNDIGMGFATALRAFLRQDPNIIMVGEIRDLETGGIAIKAALTSCFPPCTRTTRPRRSRECSTWGWSRSTWPRPSIA
jgi:hypothetical protein